MRPQETLFFIPVNMSAKDFLYPLKFHPILKEKIWGGTKLHDVLNKKSKGNIGESWELSGVSGFVSEVSNGELKGNNLNELLEKYQSDLVGERVFNTYGSDFPLLFKFIDARDNLSVQLHPDNILAKERHNSFGKTEMWYIVDTDPGAKLIIGFNQTMNETIYRKYLSEEKITEILHSEEIKQGDTFFIAPGTVHAIGAGTLLAEIQQTSDITYRIFDWDRPGSNGEMRELHTNLALKAINYEAPNARLNYLNVENIPILLCASPYFETNKLVLTHALQRNLSTIDTFRVYMCVAGKVQLQTEHTSVEITKGETVLVPACIDKVILKTNSATLLEVYIP